MVILSSVLKNNIDIPCSFNNNKEPVNSFNLYNHNYENKFCYCGKEEEDEMIQCTLCEDWYHCEHLEIYVNFKLLRNHQMKMGISFVEIVLKINLDF